VWVSTGAEVMAAVQELSGPGIRQQDIAAKIGCSQSQVSLAATVLVQAPELAEPVCAGKMGLARASAIVRKRSNPPRPPRPQGAGELWPPVYLTVTEAAGKLSRPRSAVLRLVHTGQLRSVRLGRSYRIPEAEVCRHLAGVPCDSGTLDVEECAGILRCSAGTIYGLLHHGYLVGERCGERGHYRIPIAEFRRFLSDATR
jgi:excisionase family DNA binding protein